MVSSARLQEYEQKLRQLCGEQTIVRVDRAEGRNALTVAPTDLKGTTQVLYTSLTMPPGERKRRATALKKSIEEEAKTNWFFHLPKDAVSLIQEPAETST